MANGHGRCDEDLYCQRRIFLIHVGGDWATGEPEKVSRSWTGEDVAASWAKEEESMTIGSLG